MSELKQEICAAIDALKDELISIADYIHANPELGCQEFKASKILTDTAEKYGFQVERGLCDMPTAFRCTFEGQPGGRKVAFLAEYDALEGIGHGCGHNLIGTIALGSALAMAKVLPKVPGMIGLFGSPAEEPNVDGAGGKAPMAAAGLFDDYAAAMMVHPGGNNGTGGASSLACCALEVTFRGRPSHAGAAPERGVNALNGIIETFNGINALRQHVRSDVRIHGIITNGGQAANVIPELAVARLIVRASDLKYMEEVREKVKRIAEGASIITGASVEFGSFFHTFEPTLPNITLADAFKANYEALGLRVPPYISGTAGRGSTDFGNISRRTPSTGARIAIGPENIPGHSHEMCAAAGSPRGHEALIVAAKGMAMTALDLLLDAELARRAREEFAKARKAQS